MTDFEPNGRAFRPPAPTGPAGPAPSVVLFDILFAMMSREGPR
jgi:hypothetical protein